MNKNLEFWKFADCDDCPVINNNIEDAKTCPFDSNNSLDYKKILECPHLNSSLEKDLEVLTSSNRGYSSKEESFCAEALDFQYEDMFVSSAKALIWLIRAVKLEEENKKLKDEIEFLKNKI